jgi:23S rRNA C2498 (ribose-2'-O)-methylase RlmM
MTLIVGLTIKFVDSDANLKNLLLVCRDFNDILKPTILKQSLLRADQHRINEKRRDLWL